MAGKISKNNPAARNKAAADGVHIKRVKRANMWCVTTITDNKQTQAWSNEKPTL